MPGPTILTTKTSTEYEKPVTNPGWWTVWTNIRRVGVFLLGSALIVDGMSRGDNPWPEFIIGGLMVGAFPLESLPWLQKPDDEKKEEKE